MMIDNLEINENTNWEEISKIKELSEDFIRKYQDKVDWYYISGYQKLSEDFIREFKDKVDWYYISTYQKLSDNFIREFKDKVDWYYISTFQKLSDNFIREFKEKVDWLSISIYQKLSENFIREFKDLVEWYQISIYQKLSEDFIREFKGNVEWYYISKYQKLSEDFIKEFNLEISDNWNYLTTEEKKKFVVETNKYECFDDYFIAFKSIRSDRYSHFNLQYQYLRGNTYYSHCDCTSNEDSFGLSAWTEDEAREFNNKGMIVKVKVNYCDVGRIVHNDGKIRCSKFEVLN